jgi:hypothetical protein
MPNARRICATTKQRRNYKPQAMDRFSQASRQAAGTCRCNLGFPSDRLKTISYGKERAGCIESNESCWQRNRRAHFSPGQ